MKKIEVDDEVFKYLQNKAIPFVDSPNTVLRKILLLDSKENEQAIHVSSGMTTNEKEISSDDFIQKILREQFNEIFKVNPPYRMMFSSDSNLIYFQNFNKSNESLWYRITEKPFDLIKRSSKNAKICLTCPPEKKAYLIPINDILIQIKRSGWDKKYLEINIDKYLRWRELDWMIGEYLMKL